MLDIVITCGDINGIGPEVAVKAMNSLRGKDFRFLFVAPSSVLSMYPSEIDFKIVDNFEAVDDGENYLIDMGEADINPGEPTVVSGEIAYSALMKALEYVRDKRTSAALVTAPISKYALQLAGIDMPGHTEILAKYFDTKNYCMMFLSQQWRAALATIHIPISEVPKRIAEFDFKAHVSLFLRTLTDDFEIEKPSIAVLGLNPHAGEKGRIGKEETDILVPLVEEFKDFLRGPFVPDAFFAQKLYVEFDLVYGMYHDQVLIPFKLMNGGEGVNFTAGLPIVRTSPDHGTAFDIAGKNRADASSMISAIQWAYRILTKRKRLND